MASLFTRKPPQAEAETTPSTRVGMRSGGTAARIETSLSKIEQEWKTKTHARLLEVIDLSLIGTLGDDRARMQIREISQRLMIEQSAPLNVEQRKRVVQC